MKDGRTPFKETEQTPEPGSDMADIKTKEGKRRVENKTTKRKKKRNRKE